MYVYAVPLRRRGVRLSKAEVQLAAPVAGFLTLQPSLGLRTNQPCISAWITETEDTTSKNLLAPMEKAWVKRAVTFQMIVCGTERVDRGRKDCDWFPQAWWLRMPARAR